MRYEPIHFQPYEFLPPVIYNQFGNDGLYFMDDRILWTADALRDYFNKSILVNTWFMGGEFSQRGYRTIIDPKTLLTAHRFGKGFDFEIVGVPSDEFRSLARLGMLEKQLQYITRIEDQVNWNHADCMGLPRQHGEQIEFFKP